VFVLEIADKNILVVGLGISGIAATRFLSTRGASVTVTDIAGEQKLGDHALQIREMGVKMELGQHRLETFENSDLIVLSPGVPHTLLPIKRAQEKGIAVWSEIELASKFIQQPIVAVTGTNGKTTTTELIGNMLKSSGLKVFVGGNIGIPLISYVEKEEKADIVVVEVSSFQLDSIETFRPSVGTLLNITKDHLDRYSDFAAYAKSKGRLFENQQENDTAVLNGSDPIVNSICANIKSSKILFFAHETISICNNKNGTKSLDLSGINLLGKHNRENASAAALTSLAAGGTLEGVQSALDHFKGLPHRLEYVTTINNVRYYDDSKATNIDAVTKALESFDKPVVLIMGGRYKGGDFQVLEDLVSRHTKKIIALGEAKENIMSSLGHVKSTILAASMEEAVFLAHDEADPGDVVLLSPGCSSFDMYNSYAERGDFFCKAVENLK
jgi:UDP-N-acetylmuramoylalanine--D-glutamate ligase